MRAEELQRFDWVGRVYDDRRIIEDYRQIDWIRTGEIGLLYLKVWSIGCLEPIPITSDILAKNGWEKKGIMVFKNDVIRLGWKEDGTLIFGYYEWPIKVIYVHHLQHILRDVGLVEYANSMRV